MGQPKHALPHPAGGSWGGHLVRVFATACPGGPIQVLGAPLPDRPELPRLEDPRQGPAVALRTWSRAGVPAVARWWVVGCDQVRWDPPRLTAWLERVEAADPGATAWVLARHQGHLQPLGGLLAAGLLPALGKGPERSLLALVDRLPHVILDVEGKEWVDANTPEARGAFEREAATAHPGSETQTTEA